MRLIDADTLKDVLMNHRFYYCGENEYSEGVAEGFLLARLDVTESPTIDPVIRCKDCEYFVNTHLKKDGTEDHRCKPDFCEYHRGYMEENDFCSMATKV